MVNITGNGFDEYFKEIYKSLYTVIFRIAYRITGDSHKAEDICHEAFIKYYEKGKLFPSTNQTKYWLIRVVKNLSFNNEKKKQREQKAFDNLKKTTIVTHESSEAEFMKTSTEAVVQQSLDKLPYNLRIVLILKEFGGLTYKQIGSIIGITEANVKVRVYRGRAKLEQIIKEWDGYVP